MPKKLKLLCMHGFGTNKEFMKMQVSSIQSQLKDLAEFIYIDGPVIVPKELVFDSSVFKHLQGHTRSWFSKNLSKTSSLQQILKSLQEIRVAIQSISQDFDGAFCFSQGAMAFQTISLYHKLGHIKWQSFKNIKFFMNFSSVAAKYSLSKVKWERFQIPSIHILSSQDVYFQTMMVTLTRFNNPQFIFHVFGHKIPLLGVHQKKKLINFIKKHGFNKKGGDIQYKSKL